jgi:glycosyltransferase involved in cell wall biosynthesis
MALADFSIVLPVYNEEGILESSVTRLIQALKKRPKLSCVEIILVENGSRDSSWEICQKLAQHFPQVRPLQMSAPSYGGALKTGIMAAHGEAVVIFNVDFWDLQFVEKGLQLLQACDVVVGSKTLIASQDERPWYRRLFSYFFNVLLRIVFNFPGTDTHGIKVLRREKILPLVKYCYAQRELFDTELMLRASKQRFTLAELPVRIREVRPTRYNHYKRFSNTVRDISAIFWYRYGKRYIRYGAKSLHHR